MKRLRSERRRIRASAIVRTIAAAFAAVMLAWTLLPAILFGIFNLGTIALLLIFGIIFSAALFWPDVKRILSQIHHAKAGRWLLRITAAVLALCFGYGGFITGRMIAAAHADVPSESALPVIILGCQTNGYEPSPMLLSRLEQAKKYLNENPDAVVIVSGAMGSNEGISEAESMRAWLERNGVASDRIIKEEQSTSTEENLRFSAQLMQEYGLGTSAVIVTDWWHELRAIYWARENGITAGAQPCATWTLLLPVFYVREVCGVIRLLLIGY